MESVTAQQAGFKFFVQQDSSSLQENTWKTQIWNLELNPKQLQIGDRKVFLKLPCWGPLHQRHPGQCLKNELLKEQFVPNTTKIRVKPFSHVWVTFSNYSKFWKPMLSSSIKWRRIWSAAFTHRPRSWHSPCQARTVQQRWRRWWSPPRRQRTPAPPPRGPGARPGRAPSCSTRISVLCKFFN